MVEAHVVLKPASTPAPALARELQDFVKAQIAPYKYPRSVNFADKLPRTETGKLQRFKLRNPKPRLSEAAMPDKKDQDDTTMPDLASRLTQDHHQSLKLWLRMLSCTVRIENEIRSRLRATFDITLPRFDLMAQLERHPEGLRMGELSKRMMVTGGNVTGITDQLERESWWCACPTRRTGVRYSVKLTGGAARVRRDGARARRLDGEMLKDIPAEEKAQMIELLSQMKHGLDGLDAAVNKGI